MLTPKTIARTAAATAGLALVVTGALAPATAAEGNGSERGQARAAAAQDRDAQDADRSKGRSATAPHGNAYGHAEDKDADKDTDKGDRDGEKSNNGLGDERGNGHTPVTVCHATGNGGFVEITFDENAFEKHVENHMKHMDDHHDYVVTEGAGCEDVVPTTTEDEVGDDEGVTDEDGTTGTTPEEAAEDAEDTTDAEVLGVETTVAAPGTGTPEVLGAEATVAGSAAAPAAGPVNGILPQTGAAPLALAAAAGLGLVGAGSTLVARRRRQA